LAAAVLSPIGFLCDHIEVLYDLDVEASAVCREIGLPMVRAKSVNDHPRFADAMADAVMQTVTRYSTGRPLTLVASST
jgi:ferrochelatase